MVRLSRYIARGLLNQIKLRGNKMGRKADPHVAERNRLIVEDYRADPLQSYRVRKKKERSASGLKIGNLLTLA